MTGLSLTRAALASLQGQLPTVAEHTLAAVTAEVPEYADAFDGDMGATIANAVQVALGGFLRLASGSGSGDRSPLGPARDAAYRLGRGEARSGRTVDALLAAYRVGARVAWREMSATAVEHGLASATVAQFAELVFAYIDELSAASVAGHSDELATSGRVREQYLQRLGQALLADTPLEQLLAGARRADWAPPDALSAVLLPAERTRDALAVLDARTVRVPGDVADLDGTDVLLTPDSRRHLLRVLRHRPAVIGPRRPWTTVAASFRRALRAAPLTGPEPVDTEAHLVTLVLRADPEALADLREQVLTPLASLRPATAERLTETLRSWLLHQGRRDDVAADLHVHAQTVRYRMTQLRELYGEQLTDPELILRLTVALAEDPRAYRDQRAPSAG